MPSRGSRRSRFLERFDPDRFELSAEVREFLDRMEADLHDLSQGDGAPPGFDPNVYIAPGLPRIRPVLVILSSQAAIGGSQDFPYDNDATEQVAIAAELLHAAIAVHDTALGRQGGRRRRAARRLIGGAVGWLGGNHLSLRALELARHAPAPEIVGDLLDALRDVADAHALSQEFQHRVPTPDDAMAMAEGHSGAVFNFACRSGARLSGADRKTINALGRYGRNAGIAWDLAEDISHFTGPDSADTDSAEVLADQAEAGRPGITVSLAAETDPKAAEDWQKLIQTLETRDAERLVKRIHATDAVFRGQEQVLRASWSARRALQGLAPSAEREVLDELAAGMAK